MDIVFVSGIAWAIAQFIKIILRYIHIKKLDLKLLWGSGGFPSAHSAFVTCLMLQIGFVEGFKTSLFALALGFWAVVIYDSFNVRYAVGLQGKAINDLAKEIADGQGKNYSPLKEVLGHTPTQVAAGVLLGSLIAMMRISFIPFTMRIIYTLNIFYRGVAS